MKATLKAVSVSLAAVLMLTLSAACSSTADEVTSTIDCHGICQRYADCFNSDYDVEGCTDKCENSADSSDARQRKLNDCHACIDDRSCTSATFNCADECVGIVP